MPQCAGRFPAFPCVGTAPLDKLSQLGSLPLGTSAKEQSVVRASNGRLWAMVAQHGVGACNMDRAAGWLKRLSIDRSRSEAGSGVTEAVQPVGPPKKSRSSRVIMSRLLDRHRQSCIGDGSSAVFIKNQGQWSEFGRCQVRLPDRRSQYSDDRSGADLSGLRPEKRRERRLSQYPCPV